MDKLYVLYLNNTVASPELATLLGYTPEKKIIFQFFHDVSNNLTLDAWPRQGGNYNKAQSKLLHLTNFSNLDITGVGVHLGNCHLNAAECNKLLAVVNTVGYEFILFYPNVLNSPIDGFDDIAYDIYGSSILPVTIHDFITQITSTANPSPPRPAGEA